MTATAGGAQSAPGTSTSRLRERPGLLDGVFARVGDRVRSGDLPAAALAIGDADGKIRSETFAQGTGDMNAGSLFFLASVTKPIFATAFMRLVEDGKLSLDDPIQRHLPEFSGSAGKAEVTSRHLLTHTSGVPDFPIDQIRSARPSAARMTRFAIDSPLNFKAGTRWEYCSSSFYLLGLLIHRLTGMPYVRHLQARLLSPLGMNSTFDPRRAGRPIVPVQGVGADNRFIRFFLLRYMAGAAVPGGGLFGTLDDLLRFGAATLRPTKNGGRYLPLAPETIEQMVTDQTRGTVGIFDGEERLVHFGLGWGKPTLMGETPGSDRVVSHGGATGTRLWIDPDEGLVFVFFTNRWSPDRGPEIEAIHGTYAALGVAADKPPS